MRLSHTLLCDLALPKVARQEHQMSDATMSEKAPWLICLKIAHFHTAHVECRQYRREQGEHMPPDEAAWETVESGAQAVHRCISAFVNVFTELALPARLGQNYKELVDFSRFYTNSS